MTATHTVRSGVYVNVMIFVFLYMIFALQKQWKQFNIKHT